MKLLWTGLIIVILSVGVFAMPEDPQNILIVELQTGSIDTASEEFVELYNPNDVEIDMTDWLLQYKSATGATWSTKSVLSGTIEPRGRYLVASSDYLVEEAMDSFSGGFAKSAGHIRVIEPATEEDGEDVTHDLIGWGISADSPEGGEAALAPNAGESLKRIVDEDGYFIDSDINSVDFIISNEPTPATDDEIIIVEPIDDGVLTNDQTLADDDSTNETNDIVDDDNAEETEVDNDESDGVGMIADDTLPTTISYKKVKITELYIDPISPQTDADDEFIELFNPNKTSVQLENYVLQTGNTYSRSFMIPELKIGAGQYLALYSIDTNLPLSNSGSRARILDPNGEVIFETSLYDKAKAGNSWVLGVDGKWQWTAQQTPGAVNIVVVPVSTSRKKKSSTKRSSRRKSSKSNVKSAKTSKSGSDARVIYQEPASLEDTELNMAVLVGVGTMAVGYGIYEYRRDITNRIHQFRKYLKSRR